MSEFLCVNFDHNTLKIVQVLEFVYNLLLKNTVQSRLYLKYLHLLLYFDKASQVKESSSAKGTLLGIVLNLGSPHKFCVLHSVSFAIRDRVENVDSSCIRNLLNSRQP